MLWLLIAIAALAMSERPTPKEPNGMGDARKQKIIAIIVNAARAVGLSPQVALAFADLESGLNPNAIGDKDWPYRRGGELYRNRVLAQLRLTDNPAVMDPAPWVSYGLFQLLAADHVGPHEHPRRLLDPTINAARGAAFIARLLEQNDGDPYATRLRYVGCRADGSRCDAEHVDKTLAKLSRALGKWESYG